MRRGAVTRVARGLLPALFCFAAAATAPAAAQTFTAFVARVHASPAPQRPAMVDSFLAAQQRVPLIESDTVAVFLYRGRATRVTVPSDANGWNPDTDVMQQLASTDLWYCIRAYAADARIDYKFTVDGAWITDPRNSATCSGGFGPNSELRMPRYVDRPELHTDPAVPRGALWDTAMSFDGRARTVRVYTPAAYDTARGACPVILLHDGLEYISLGAACTVLDNLIAARRIPPTIAVFVPPVQRKSEYAGARMDAYARFISREVMGAVDARFRTRRDLPARAVAGASDGGNIALYTAMSYPDVFGCVAPQSSNIVPVIDSTFRHGPALPLRVYMSVGTYDIPILLTLARGFAPLLWDKGYEHVYKEVPEGHSWCNWRARFSETLLFLFGEMVTSDPALPEHGGLLLPPAYPQPATGATIIPFRLERPAHARLSISDALGREVALLADASYPAGTHTARWDASAASAGAYVCVLRSGPVHIARNILVW